jgi:hypothetical protein
LGAAYFKGWRSNPVTQRVDQGQSEFDDTEGSFAHMQRKRCVSF